jgi:hypothetical protein
VSADPTTVVAPAEAPAAGRAWELGATVRRVAASFPAPLWLAALVLVSTAYQASFGLRVPAPWIVPDELLYSELAKSLAATGEFAVREVPGRGYGLVYPALLAPVYALFESLPAAYAAAKLVNALVMSLAALPAYALARRVVSRSGALIAAALTLAVPSMAYTSVLMTENAFYPAFLLWALLVVRMLERPTAARQLAALGATGGAFLVRPQAIALAAALVLVIALVALLDARADGAPLVRNLLHRLGAYRFTWALFAGGAIAAAGAAVARGRSPLDALGAYRAALGQVRFGEAPRWIVLHVAELDLYLGVLPFAAALVVVPLAFRRDEDSRGLRLLAALLTASAVSMIVLVATFSTQRLASLVHERNLFYLAPLFLVLLLAWVERGLPRPPRLAWPAAALAVALPGVVPYGDLVYNARFEALAIVPWYSVVDVAVAPIAAVATAGALAACFLLVRAHARAVVVGLVVANFWFVGALVQAEFESASRWTLDAGIGADRDWIDRAVGPDADVAVVWAEDASATGAPIGERRRTVWENEFFNRSVGRVFHLGPPLVYNLPSEPVERARGGEVRTTAGAPVRAAYVLADRSLGVHGRVVAADPDTGMALYAVGGALRLGERARS